MNDTVTLKTGRHVIKGLKGEFYLCDPDVLAQKYEKKV